MTRRSMLAAAVAAALSLAACSSDSEPAAEAADAADVADAAEQDATDDAPAADPDLPAAEVDFAGQTAVLGAVDLKPVGATEDTGVHAPGLALDVTATGVVATIPVDAYEDITGDRLRVDSGEEAPTEVRAADGHVFAVAKYETTDPQWRPRGEEPRTEATVRVQGSEVGRLFSTADGTRHTGTLVVSLPKDHGPADAVIEIETDDAFQSVSLVDGTRVDTDVPQAYPGPQEVTLESAERLDVSFPHWHRGEITVQGEVIGAFTTPYLSGQGWASPGQHYLSVAVDWHLSERTTYDETTMRVETADGDAFQPINDFSSHQEVFARDAVFQLPVDVEAVTVVIESAYQTSPTNKELIEQKPIIAELSIG